jgi:hypothetical protein
MRRHGKPAVSVGGRLFLMLDETLPDAGDYSFEFADCPLSDVAGLDAAV